MNHIFQTTYRVMESIHSNQTPASGEVLGTRSEYHPSLPQEKLGMLNRMNTLHPVPCAVPST